MASQPSSLVVNPSTSSVTAGSNTTTSAADAASLRASRIAMFCNDPGLDIVTRLVQIPSQTSSAASNNKPRGSQ
ncbi:hypothetical protein MAPG_03777 [Magnaporthiopsis poae ATCC 64411]|uniref:Uncharacterized protein n=1 Tax=Magnaporthiopsis poae (strain ATCC 64411 / 73-15) TaxID=644358 RepID=A0A0C4DUY0_MAGP6|nr:hypothetical protein MAPG_03777 [Magnaporthiopsis poae ATCC 64411]